MSLLGKLGIKQSLDREGLEFVEMNTRMNYGYIGNIQRNGKGIVTIFPECFYIADKDFALNNKTLKLIRSIQVEYKELSK